MTTSDVGDIGDSTYKSEHEGHAASLANLTQV